MIAVAVIAVHHVVITTILEAAIQVVEDSEDTADTADTVAMVIVAALAATVMVAAIYGG